MAEQSPHHKLLQEILGRRASEIKDQVKDKEHLEEEKAAKIAHQKSLTEDQKTTTGLKKQYANWAFCFLVAWCLLVAFLVLAQGFQWWCFKISDTVLSVIVGTTTVNAIALAGFVVKGIFAK